MSLQRVNKDQIRVDFLEPTKKTLTEEDKLPEGMTEEELEVDILPITKNEWKETALTKVIYHLKIAIKNLSIQNRKLKEKILKTNIA